MYYPYVRGKQYELITIRENASLLADAGFTPIIEPVKEKLDTLDRALSTVREAGGDAIVVINPRYGHHHEGGNEIVASLNAQDQYDGIVPGLLLKEEMSVDEVITWLEAVPRHNVTLIHAGFTEGRLLSEACRNEPRINRHIFFEEHGKLYQRYFPTGERILLRDGFKRRRNADHPPTEHFSDLHVTYRYENMDGFGDFLIVGDDYVEGGGPAYAIAIHLTFIDTEQDDQMFIHHFKSDTQDTPTDPAGKFKEALDKLIHALGNGDSKLIETPAIREFRELHARAHFPGLGYVKKLSMNHHIQTLATYLQ
ncbi:hypothetical protein SSPSH_001460 [Salinisphaera shabanensis E1L3A]|uniref:Uncharacterized protein n=1 Tax=Salinisphaera shabanensis E1L3A TaxID=1033802 RepID=U2EPF5_9GAMM|nr:sce7725 family protein [Salinisphaera shabanensis]ERJ19690.1 hypothetical protein SSPSH_001460 [Salinisphaera shabanensis E1L3A]